MLRVSCDPLGERWMILLDSLLPNRLLRSPDQGADMKNCLLFSVIHFLYNERKNLLKWRQLYEIVI